MHTNTLTRYSVVLPWIVHMPYWNQCLDHQWYTAQQASEKEKKKKRNCNLPIQASLREKLVFTFELGRSSSAYLIAAWSLTTLNSEDRNFIYIQNSYSYYRSQKSMGMVCSLVLGRWDFQSDMTPSLLQGKSRPYIETIHVEIIGREIRL